MKMFLEIIYIVIAQLNKYIRYAKRKQSLFWTYKSLNNKIIKYKDLTSEQKKECSAFWEKYNTDFKINFDFYKLYSNVTGIFDVRFIPDDIYYHCIDPYFNNWDKAKVMDNKCLYKYFFQGVKQPRTIAYRANNIWFDSNDSIISLSDVIKMLSEQEIVFIKVATESMGGKGVTCLTIDKSNNDNIKNCLQKYDSDIIIQEALTQSKITSKINPSCINTIRLISLLSENGVKIYSGLFRMGINGSKVDNFSSGGIICGIQEDGRLKPFAYTKNGLKMTKHPDSGIEFKNIILPNFEKCKQLVLSQHPHIPQFRLVSWDIALDETDEPVLIEANMYYGELDFHQYTNGPIFGDDTEKILEEVFGKK